MLTLKRTYWYILVLAIIGLLLAVGTTFSGEAGMTAGQPQLDQPRDDGGQAAPVENMVGTTGSNVTYSSPVMMPAGSGGTGTAAFSASGGQDVYKPVQDGEGDSK